MNILGYKFDRLEFAGSLGDLGTIIPISMGLVLVNGLNPQGLFFAVGIYYIISGLYFKVTVPVQPMKVIGAYAIGAGLSCSQVMSSVLLMGVILLIIGSLDALKSIRKYTPKSVVRGVQLSTGLILMIQGVKFMVGTSKLQEIRLMAEPYLTLQSIGPVHIGVVFGIAGTILTLLFLNNKKIPASLLIIFLGLLAGVVIGTHDGLDKFSLDIYLPRFLPFAFPKTVDFTFVLLAVVLPQLPMTIGNAVIANADLAKEYFGESASKVTERGLCISMALANLFSFCIGGMPLCHGAGGLAAHYRFGARTAGSNLMIGAIFAGLSLFTGFHILSLLCLIPMSILGVLLLFAGSQLAMTIIDIENKKDMFVVTVIVGITLSVNLAAGFICGMFLAYILKSDRIKL